MNCPTCGYDVDPTTGLTCPRCTTTLDCGSLDCGECGACPSVGGVRALVSERLARRREDRADEAAACSVGVPSDDDAAHPTAADDAD